MGNQTSTQRIGVDMITTDEKTKAFQLALGSYPDGIAGASTWDASYRFLDFIGVLSIDFPYEVHQWGCDVMFDKVENVIPFSGEGHRYDVNDFSYTISGSFTAPSCIKPCSFLINNGDVIWGRACHANTWDGEKPETVLYCLTDGTTGMTLARTMSDMLEPSKYKWAIGGGQIVKDGVASFNLKAEGFVGAFSDVVRTTAHCAVGLDKYGNAMAVYHSNCSLKEFQRRCVSIGMQDGIFIDGGHVSAINAGELRHNIGQRQGYLIQFGG